MAGVPACRGRSGCGNSALVVALLHRLLPAAGSHDSAAYIPVQFLASWRSPIFALAACRGNAAEDRLLYVARRRSYLSRADREK